MTALLIYLRWATEMWRSDTNDAVIDLVARACPAGNAVVAVGAPTRQFP